MIFTDLEYVMPVLKNYLFIIWKTENNHYDMLLNITKYWIQA